MGTRPDFNAVLFWCWILDPRTEILRSEGVELADPGHVLKLRIPLYTYVVRAFTISSPLYIRGYQIPSPYRYPAILVFARPVNSGNRRRRLDDRMIIDIVLPTSRRNALVFQTEWPMAIIYTG